MAIKNTRTVISENLSEDRIRKQLTENFKRLLKEAPEDELGDDLGDEDLDTASNDELGGEDLSDELGGEDLGGDDLDNENPDMIIFLEKYL